MSWSGVCYGQDSCLLCFLEQRPFGTSPRSSWARSIKQFGHRDHKYSRRAPSRIVTEITGLLVKTACWTSLQTITTEKIGNEGKWRDRPERLPNPSRRLHSFKFTKSPSCASLFNRRISIQALRTWCKGLLAKNVGATLVEGVVPSELWIPLATMAPKPGNNLCIDQQTAQSSEPTNNISRFLDETTSTSNLLIVFCMQINGTRNAVRSCSRMVFCTWNSSQSIRSLLSWKSCGRLI